MSKFDTREAWLAAAVVRLKQRVFSKAGIDMPVVRVSIGWPSTGGLKKNPTIGQCWRYEASTDKVPQIFISPTLGESTIVVLATLVHEMIHAWDDCQSGHKGKFAKAARKVGLAGKLTVTYAEEGSDLWNTLDAITESLGAIPHGALVVSAMNQQRPKQTTRMLKLVAPDCCGYTVRTTKKWLEEQGNPLCPHGETMELE
jgi:hypothetical protein